MARRGKYLFVNPFLHPPGGGEGVANWMLEVLSERGDVTVLTWDPPNFEEIDRYYGTDLARRQLKTVSVAPYTRKLLQRLGLPHHLLKIHWLERRAKALRKHYSYCLSAFNDLDLGEPAVQYIHHPVASLEDDSALECPWPDNLWLRTVWPLYQKALLLISGHNLENVRNNITVTNSYWTAATYRRALKAPVHAVIYPPPLSHPRPPADASRRDAFLTVARLDRTKNWPTLIKIIEQVRARGHKVTLTLAGSRSDDELLTEIERLAELHAEWVTLHLNQPREVLDQLMAEHRYGIHGMVDEHYGMAVAELVLAGCLTFVHDSGGQVEIVTHPDARYSSLEDAVDKIDALLSSPRKREALAQCQAANRPNLTREKFLQSFHQFLDRLESKKRFEALK